MSENKDKKASSKEKLSLIDLSDIQQLNLTTHAKNRLKNRFGITQSEDMIKWALSQIHSGHVTAVDVIANQLRIKIRNNNIILIVNVVGHSLITAYPVTDSSSEKDSDDEVRSLMRDKTYADFLEYLQGPVKGYLALQKRGLVANINCKLKNLLLDTETAPYTLWDERLNVDNLDVDNLQSEIQEIQHLIDNYKDKINHIRKDFLM